MFLWPEEGLLFRGTVTERGYYNVNLSPVLTTTRGLKKSRASCVTFQLETHVYVTKIVAL